MSQQRILVIEDDTAIRQGIVDALQYSGYATIEAADGRVGADMAVGCDCDLLLLDLVLPHKDGLDILADVRATRPTLPVIILTARGSEADRIRGLRLGADDYVVKPFSVGELLARVEAVLRRSPERPTDLDAIAFPGGVADLARREVRYDGAFPSDADTGRQAASGTEESLPAPDDAGISASARLRFSELSRENNRVELSEREAELLRYLAMNAGRAVSRDEILARVWRLDPKNIETRTIDMHIARLREKLRDPDGQLILTVRGKGYALGAAAQRIGGGGGS
jgi:DNA-binding response OmpR family regulator